MPVNIQVNSSKSKVNKLYKSIRKELMIQKILT